ncbi:cysteine-rich secretory protein 2-like [Paramacrobiotus metropolitanus]|uniref:cysteine-rich secretory protein 2-like n=1 Tax=Paramacrobiotus metropolitanus TaxID=2943436 RepID=UPI002445B96B|nr:cysteine-rich secretory protein 2-like [Paramacrobiotus metropolitanus]
MSILAIASLVVVAAGFVAGQTVNPDTTVAATQQQIVDLHNALRRKNPSTGSFELSWDSEAAQKAADWAALCHFWHPNSTTDQPLYRKTSKYDLGQNLYSTSGGPVNWQSATDNWYSEIADFIYGQPPKNSKAAVGHYTQIVWNTTFVVGCAYKDCGSFKFYVCNYGPAGNISPNLYAPYEAGTACAKCTGETTCRNGLCLNPCPVTNTLSNCDTSVVVGGKTYPPLGCTTAYASQCQATCQCKGKGKLY